MKANIFKYAAIVLFFAGSFSCEETVRESLQILIRNRTDNLVHVTLYPKGDTTGACYIPYEIGGGGKIPKYDLLPINKEHVGGDELIFESRDLAIKPYTLALREFDSIYIRTADNQIIFTHESVTGYSENIFSEDSTWDFQIGEGDMPVGFRKNPQKYYQYTFSILKDKIIINYKN